MELPSPQSPCHWEGAVLIKDKAILPMMLVGGGCGQYGIGVRRLHHHHLTIAIAIGSSNTTITAEGNS